MFSFSVWIICQSAFSKQSKHSDDDGSAAKTGHKSVKTEQTIVGLCACTVYTAKKHPQIV